MKGIVVKVGLVFGLVIVLLSTNITPGLLGRSSDLVQQKSADALFIPTSPKTSVFSLNVFDKTNQKKIDVALSTDDATLIFDKLKELKSEMTQHPFSEETHSLKIAFIDLLVEKGVISNGVSKEAYLSLLNPKWVERLPNTGNTRSLSQPYANRGTSVLCSLGGEGTGILIPLFLLPRPRIAMLWLGTGLSSAANLLTGKGYIAGGAQAGFTVGFMGIGISYAIPGYTLYGFIGYALLASTTAEEVAHYPPNRAPEISDAQPADREQNVPLTTTNLQFRIQDADADLMSYTVTTNPDIGSANGNLKPFGVYTVPISGLVDLTQYTWHIQVTDGKETTDQTLTFTTEAIAPIISNPMPADGERDVPMDLAQLQFSLKDYQGDAMDYTVETTPNIGFKHETGVHDATITVPISGMTYGATYRWYVNATDGTHWTRKLFTFETGYPSLFDPYEFGWNYRKQITIHHTQVADDLEDYPVLINTIDPDLIKAQDDGGDILFMNAPGVAKRQYHEIENFEQTMGNLVTWVNIPALSSSQDMVFYMYYGNPDCINQQYPEKTWNPSYKAVWHLNNNPIGTIVDSTANSNDGISNGGMTISDLVEGKTGKCLHFDGANDYISFTEFTGSLNTGTCIAWVKTTTNVIGAVWGEAKTTTDKPYIACGKYYDDNLWFARDVYGTSSNYQGFKPIGMNDGQWHQAAWLSKGTGNGNTFYFDGQPVSLNWQDGNDPDGMWFDDQSTDSHSIGALDRPTSRSHWTGLLDEIRITDTPLSAAWIATEYTNQNNPAGFLNIGPEVPGP
jgi:hypothetical protein